MSSDDAVDGGGFEWVSEDVPNAELGEWPPADFAFTVEHYDEDPPHCTIYPRTASGEETLSQWISADGEAFVDAKRMA